MATISVNSSRSRSVTFQAPESFNETERTFDAIIATDTPVPSVLPDGTVYMEILSFDPSHVDLSRVRVGAPVFDNHVNGGVFTQIGAVKGPNLIGNGVEATVKLSRNAKLKDLIQDIKDGIVSNLSAGYSVFKYEDVTPPEAKVRWLKAVNWRINEVSFAPVNADVHSRARSLEDSEFIDVEINDNQMLNTSTQGAGETPNPENPTPVPAVPTPAPTPTPAPAPPTPAPAPVETPAPAEVPATERARALGIAEAYIALQAAGAATDPNFITTHLTAGTSVEQARALVVQTLKAKSPLSTQQGYTTPAPAITADVIDKTRALMEIGLCRKYGVVGQTFTNEEIVGSEKYRNMRILDVARNYISASTGDTSVHELDQVHLAKRALISSSTSDFLVMLEGAARRVLLAEYALASDTWRKIAITGSVSDFREWSRLRGGSIGNLDQVNENGEFKNKPIPDGYGEKVSVKTFGNTVNVTRQMLINDDLGYFLQITGKMARSAARTIEQKLYDMINLNGGLGPVMTSDNKTLYHLDHGNIGPNGAYSATTIAAARDLIAYQKDVGSNDWLDLYPETILVPTALRDTAIALNINDYTNEASKFQQKNLYKGLFNDIISSPRLTSPTRSYLFANKDIAPVWEVTFLNGVQTPFMDEREEFDVDGKRWKIRLDFGVAPIDWKGTATLAGA